MKFSKVLVLAAIVLSLASTSPSIASTKSIKVNPMSVDGVAANCIIPDAFNLKLEKKLAPKRNSSGQKKTQSVRLKLRDENIGRIITAKVTGKRVIIREHAFSLRDAGSCRFTFKS